MAPTCGWRIDTAPKKARAKAVKATPAAAPAVAVPSPAADDAIVLAAVRAAQDDPGRLLSPGDVRAATALPKDRFDAAALRLQSAGKVVLHHHDAGHLFPAADQARWVYDGEWYYIGIALRRGA